MKHIATCSCGQLSLTCMGEINKTSMCHCLECQKRTGSVFGIQARLPRDQVIVEGKSTEYTRTGDSGCKIEFHFCPTCGSTVYWYIDAEGFRETIIIAAGNFIDPKLPAPTFSVYKDRKHHWVEIPSSVIEDWD